MQNSDAFKRLKEKYKETTDPVETIDPVETTEPKMLSLIHI